MIKIWSNHYHEKERWWPAFPLSWLEIKGQEMADTLYQNILGPHMNIQLMIETDRWTY